MSGGRDVARAIDALRRGWPVTIDAIAFLAVETTDDDGLAQFDGEAPADLLISGNRGATLKLANQRDGTPAGPVRIARSGSIGLDAAIAIADPSLDLASPLKGPFHTVALAQDEAAAQAALRLARLAGLLPAFFLGGSGTPALAIASATVLEFDEADSLAIASRARLPTRYAEKGEVVAFRSELDATEHVALLVGEPGGEPPLIRLHSECLTGDVLASLKCDCGPQLDDALAAIAASGWGILLYLRQEGRGIGLINKLRAYALQDQGFDTMEANVRLGFAEDERDFEVAARMLELLGQDEVRLLTNNPDKAAALTAAGITIAAVVPLKAGRNPHNTAYLDTKRKRGGHRL